MTDTIMPSILAGKSVSFRRTLAASIAVALAALVATGIVLPLLLLDQEYSQENANLKNRISRYQAISNSLATEIKDWRNLEQVVQGKNYIYDDDEVSVSVARLEQYLQQQIRARQLTAVRLLPATPVIKNQLTLLPVAIELTGPSARLADLFFTLENQPPLLRFDQVEVIAPDDVSASATIKATMHAFHMKAP